MIYLSRDELEKNFLQDKVAKMNRQIYGIKDKEQLVVWGAGIHSDYLFKYTNILKYDFKIVDNKKSGEYFGKAIVRPNEIEWETVTAVIISGHKSIEVIIKELHEKYRYQGEIVFFYEPNEMWDFWKLNHDKENCFWGNFSSFEEASRVADIWNESETVESELKVLRQVMQQPKEWYWTQWLQKNLLHIYGELDKKHLSVLDFGGGFGQEYFNDRNLLKHMNDVEWVVVDQKEHVKYGQQFLENEQLKFAESIEKAGGLVKEKFSLLILGSVLQYINSWEEFLEQVIGVGARYILINRQNVADEERVCIQNMGNYGTKSVFRIYNEQELLDKLTTKYEIFDEYEYAFCGAVFSDLFVKEKCWLFKRKE